MGSKFGLAGGIPERRVRPIWDAIDSRQYKNALKHSIALLSKHPNSPYALALKALILERMGKPEEALSICFNAKELLHTTDIFLMDDLTLSTLQIVFQRLNRLDLATNCYEFACGRFPTNLELMMGLFNCYVREYSYVKQQQTAIKMYKLANEERYLLWAVCSIQLQVLCGQGEEKLLALAEGLLKKHISAHGLQEPEAVFVYISTLEKQRKYGDALEILSGKLGSLLTVGVDRLRMEGRLLAQSGDYNAAISTFQKILLSSPDDWECFLQYLSCELGDDKSWCFGPAGVFPESMDTLLPIPDDVFDSRITDALDFVKKLQIAGAGEPVRGPYLADIEIERRKRLHQKGDSEKFLDVIVQYFCRFGHLSCFCSDVEAFLEPLSHEEKNELLVQLIQSSKSQSLGPVKSLGRLMTLHKMQGMIGKYYGLTTTELEGVAVELVHMYCKSLPLSRDLDAQESMHGEELLTMASNALVQLFWRSQKQGYVLEAVMLLEFGLIVWRYVSQYKLSLLHLYTYLGALPVAYDWYKTLDVKNILFETLLHQILPQMLSSPLWVDLSDVLNDYLKFMDDHLRESADLTFLAYRHRNYTKVIEFVQFKEVLQHSNQYLIGQLESSILQLKEKADRLQEEESILEGMDGGAQFLELASETVCKELTFNEDMQTRPWWTPTPQKNYLIGPFEDLCCNSQFTSQECLRDWELSAQYVIRKRSLLPRLIYLSVRCASASIKENAGANGSVSTSVFLELQSLLERFVNVLGFSLSDALHVIAEVSEGRKSVEDFGSDMIDWANLAVFINAWSLNPNDRGLQGLDGTRPAWNMATSVLEKCILQKLRSTRPLVCCSCGDFPVLVNLVTESLAWHGLILQSCAPSSVPCGKKKRKGGSADQPSPSSSQAIRESVQSVCETLEVVIKWLMEQISQIDVEGIELSLSSLEFGRDNGPGQVLRVLRNYISSANEVELGDRIFHALKSWSPAEVTRKMANGQRKTLSEFLHICTLKLKVLVALKQQL